MEGFEPNDIAEFNSYMKATKAKIRRNIRKSYLIHLSNYLMMLATLALWFVIIFATGLPFWLTFPVSLLVGSWIGWSLAREHIGYKEFRREQEWRYSLLSMVANIPQAHIRADLGEPAPGDPLIERIGQDGDRTQFLATYEYPDKKNGDDQ